MEARRARGLPKQSSRPKRPESRSPTRRLPAPLRTPGTTVPTPSVHDATDAQTENVAAMAPAFGRAENTLNVAWRFLLRLVRLSAILLRLLSDCAISLPPSSLRPSSPMCSIPLVDWLCRQNGFVRIHNAIAVLSARIGVMYRRLFYHENGHAAGARAHAAACAARVCLAICVRVLRFLCCGRARG